MRRRLLELICCPACRGALALTVAEAAERPAPPPGDAFWSAGPGGLRTWNAEWSLEVREGQLSCGCGARYPVSAGVPRLYPGAIEADATGGAPGVSSARTRDCYSYLWRFKAERMGWSGRGRSDEFFLGNMGLERDALAGRTLVDAGCGDGRLTSSLGALGVEAVGVDLSGGVDIGYANNGSPLVHYVQGDLLRPPLRRGRFDLLWSWGVLHHTRDTKSAFRRCAELLRPGGRMFVWIYDKAPSGRGLLIRATQRAPLRVKHLVSRALAGGNRLKRALGGGNPVAADQSADEVYFWNMDMYGPEFRHLHEAEEIAAWFAELGFERVTPRGRMAYGFGMTGDLRRAGAVSVDVTYGSARRA